MSARGEATRARLEAARQDLIAELEHQLEAGSSTALLPARLGYDNADSLARRLYRAGRPDLARPFATSESNGRYRKPCLGGCGGTCSRWSKSQRCYPCSRLGAPVFGA